MSTYEELVERADGLARDGHAEEAISVYKGAIEKAPEQGSAYYNLGLLYHSQGQLDEAIANFEKTAELGPSDASVFNNLGVLYHSKGILKEAERNLKKAIEIEPNYADALYGLGRVYQSQGKAKEAIERFSKCLKIEPNRKKANENLEKCLSEAGIDRAAFGQQKLNIGFVTYWFERGQAYVMKALRDAISEIHNTFIFARSGGMIKTTGFWDVENIATHDQYDIPREKLDHWILNNQLDIVIFVEERNLYLIDVAKNRGTRVMEMIFWEFFDPSLVQHYKKHDRILCPTEACHRALTSLGLENAEYIPWGADLGIFKPVERDENKKIIFFHPAGWGGMHARRGTEYVLKAFKNMEKQDKAELLIHTQAPLDIEEQDNIRVIQSNLSHSEIAKLYQKSDVAVLPSKWEGLGLTFPESLACGLPVITVDASPMNEFVKDGFNGFCCRVAERKRYPGVFVEGVHPDLKDMSAKMDILTDHKTLRSMRENTIKDAKEHLDWQKNSRKFMTIMRTWSEKN